MPIVTSEPNSPGWWFDRLLKRLADRRPHYDRLETYYEGTAVVPITASRSVRQSYQRLMALAGTNYAELVVEAVRERMSPSGFRTGADDNELGDGEAWRIWQANALDADSGLVHRDSLAMGMSYVIVGPPDDEIGAPLITPEDPREVIAETDPRHRRKVRAALKVYADDVEGSDRAYLYLPGFVVRASRRTAEGAPMDTNGWEWDGEAEATGVPAVPVVPFPNKPSTSNRPMGEFEPHLSILDRIGYGILNRLEIAALQAFRQRAVKGNLPTTDAAGSPVDYDDVFSAEPGALWLLGDAEIWESATTDLGPLRMAHKDDVQDLAAVTRTPLFYLTPESAQGSAEGASLAREGLVFKTTDRLVQAGENWEQVMALAFAYAADEARASRRDMECLWASPERFSLSERYDAAAKAQAAGVPWRTVMADVLQFSPQQIDRMEADRFTDALLATPAQTPAVPATVGP